MRSNEGERALLIRIFDEAFNCKAWHGPNLRGAIRRVDEEQAVCRPAAGRHNIADIVVHCAYWKYTVRRHIRGDKRGSFRLKGSNWFAVPARLSATEWKQYVSWLDEEHALLREAIETATLDKPIAAGKKDTVAARIYSIAMHDVYHAGQIQTLKALQE